MNATPHHAAAGRTLPVTIFVLSQVLILGVAVAAVGYRFAAPAELAVIPPLRNEPIHLDPVYDIPAVVSDEQLSETLTRLRPRLEGPDTKINHIDHALRFWDIKARFTEAGCPSGEEMRQILLNYPRFLQLYGKKGAETALLMNEPDGIRVRVNEGITTSSHVDHTVASLAEVGTPLDFPVETAAGPGTFRDLVDYVFTSFSLNQVEYEWSVMTFAMYVPPTTQWRTKEGQTIDFDMLARRVMRQEQPQGVCFGNHRLYTLVVLLRVDEQMRKAENSPILSPEVHAEVVSYLQDMTQRLVASQHVDGFWNIDWPKGEKPTSAAPTEVEGDRLSDRIIATGHAMEWWAMVPQDLADEILPPRHVLVAAGQWIVNTVEKLSDEDIPTHFTFLSHAGRALALWRGKFPYQVPLQEPGVARSEAAKDDDAPAP